MPLQYIADNTGRATAVIIPIDDWNGIRNRYPGVETIEGDLPQWQKDIIDFRMKEIADNPECLRPIEELFEELNSDAE